MVSVALLLIFKLEKYLPPTKENVLNTGLPVGKKYQMVELEKPC